MNDNETTSFWNNAQDRATMSSSDPEKLVAGLVPSVVIDTGTVTTVGQQVSEGSTRRTSLVLAPIESRPVFHEDKTSPPPLQIWEGAVLEVRPESNEMAVNLDAKLGEAARHTMDIHLDRVAEQDKDLVRPGAVFYLSIFERTNRNRVETFHELRFRRLPPWSARQIQEIEKGAVRLRANIDSPRTAP